MNWKISFVSIFRYDIVLSFLVDIVFLYVWMIHYYFFFFAASSDDTHFSKEPIQCEELHQEEPQGKL